jgi:hypothetical protein
MTTARVTARRPTGVRAAPGRLTQLENRHSSEDVRFAIFPDEESRCDYVEDSVESLYLEVTAHLDRLDAIC